MLKGAWILICYFSMKCYSLEYPFLPMHGKTYITDENAINTREGSTFSSGNYFEQNYNENTNYESSNNIESCDYFPNNYNNENEVDLTFEQLTADGSQAVVVLCTEGPLSSPDCISERFVCNNGRWIKSLPFNSHDCGVPPPVVNAKVYGVNTRELSHARYFCDPGFITMDKTLTICYKNQWNLSPLPICLEPEAGCGNPKPLPNGRITRFLSTPTFLPSEVIQYTCYDGFVLNDPGSEFSSCLMGNIWSLETDFKRFAECKIDCGSPPDVANASIKLSLTHVGSKAKYICDPGLITIDPAISVCGDDGAWNLKKLPKCIFPKNGCGNPRPLNNGAFLSSSPFMEDENITYVCNKGFKLLAPFGPFSTCTSKRSWSLEVKDKFPYCQSDCSKLPTAPKGGEYFIDGKVINQNESFGDEILITFACQKSFVMFRNASLYCKKGVWQWIKDGNKADPPLCGIDCGPLPTVLNAALHLTSTSAGSEAYYVCKTGFYTTDKTVSFCRVDGKWSLKSLPSCLSPTHGCGNPPWLINGRYDTVGYDGKWPIAEDGAITYSCEDGYSIIAPNGTINTCLAGNKWSLKDTSLNFPLCQSKCVSSDPIYHLKSLKFDGQTKGQIVVAGCTGHTIESDQTICNGDSWIPPKITCSSGCESPSLVKNATIIAINESFVSYVCDPGFITIDPTESFCSSNGSWDLNPLPNCLIPATGCGNPPTLLHGYYLGDPPYDKGEVVTYYCNKDFMPFAPNGFINTCMGANIWSQLNNFESFPKCLAVNHWPNIFSSAEIVKYPVLDESGYYLTGSSYKFRCGKEIIGPVTCRDGLWSPQYLKSFYDDCYWVVNTILLDLASSSVIILENKASKRKIIHDEISNSSDAASFVNLTWYLCGFPGFCRGSRSEIVSECRNNTLISCDACGMVGAAVFLSFAVLLGLAILVGNALVIMVEVRRYRRNAINKIGICKCSLAVADILTGLQILVVAVYNFSWTMNSTSYELVQEQLALRGSPVAYVFGCLLVFGVMSSLYHLVYMGGERMYAITVPLKYRMQSKNSVYLSLLLVWILSIISSTVLAWFPDKFTFTYFASTFLYYPTIQDFASDTNFTASIILLVVFYVSPYIVMSILCVGSAMLIFRNNKLTAKKLQTGRSQHLAAARKRQLSIMMTVAIMQVGFTVTLIPLAVVVALHYAGHLNCTQLAVAHMITFYLSMANSFVNVPIYSLREREFCLEIAKIFGRNLKQIHV